MKIETPLSKQLGLRYPMVIAPMFLINHKEMLVAAAEAGILGTMPSLNCRTTEDFRQTLDWVRARTDRPFGINMTIGMNTAERLEADLSLCETYRVPVIITSYGNPTDIVRRMHGYGATVFHDVINLRHGKKAQAAGVDAIIGVAAGAGGHAGTTSPFTLIPFLAQELSLPIISAGCISGGRQMAAALCLGAQLVYMGTRFIASTECAATDRYKQSVINGRPEDIVYTDTVSGIHANFLRATLPDANTPDPAAEDHDPKRWRDIWSAGQGIAVTHKILPIAAIVADVIEEYLQSKNALP